MPPIAITARLSIDDREIDERFVRASGPGGQNVNKVSSAIHLRFPIAASSLPDFVKLRLHGLHDARITTDGVIVIKAQQHRSQDQNRAEAMQRLQALIDEASVIRRARVPTRPTRGSQVRRVDEKVQRGRIKALRGRAPERE